jgi:hypothetical protein
MDIKNIEKLKLISKHYFGIDPDDKELSEVEVDLEENDEEETVELPIEYEEQ